MVPFKFRSNRNYALVQYNLTKNYLVPFLKKKVGALKDKIMLDLGCGQGGSTHALDEIAKECIGIDLADKFIQLSDKTVKFRKCSALELPFNNDSFDIIIMQDVLEHIKGLDKLFKEVSRVLKPGGIVYATFPPFYSPYSGHMWNLTSKIRYVPYAHLLPKKFLYKRIRSSKSFGIFTPEQIINDQETFSRISIRKFFGLCRKNKLKVTYRDFKLEFTSFEKRNLRFIFTILKKFRFLLWLPLLREIFVPFCMFIAKKEN